MENEQADTRRPNLSRETNFSGVNGDKEMFPWSADHVNRIGNLPVDLCSAICYDNSSSTNISYLNILYIVVRVGKIYGCRRGHREQPREEAPDSA